MIQGIRSQSCSRDSNRHTIDTDTRFLPRPVTLQKNKRGYGFVIRGLKSSVGFSFVPTTQTPALQYFEAVEPMSVSARAGILKGDYILEINQKSVVFASHEETVRLLKASGDLLTMKVVTPSKGLVNERINYIDRGLISMDDSSDAYSMVSSDIGSQEPFCTVTTSNTRPRTTVGSHSSYNQIAYLPPQNRSHAQPRYQPTKALAPSVALRMNGNIVSTARADSVSSLESCYPMPPPPSIDLFPSEYKIENKVPNRNPTKVLSHHSDLQPPKPILKQPKSLQTSMETHAAFSTHLRDAIARRRQKIESDQCSTASLDSVDDLSEIQPNEASRGQTRYWSNSLRTSDQLAGAHCLNGVDGSPKHSDGGSSPYLI